MGLGMKRLCGKRDIGEYQKGVMWFVRCGTSLQEDTGQSEQGEFWLTTLSDRITDDFSKFPRTRNCGTYLYITR